MSIRSLIRHNYKDARTYLIPNGINTEKFKPQIEKKNRILVVTRMFERKGVQYLIEALRLLNLDYETHLVGDGPYLKYLKGVVDETVLCFRCFRHFSLQPFTGIGSHFSGHGQTLSSAGKPPETVE